MIGEPVIFVGELQMKVIHVGAGEHKGYVLRMMNGHEIVVSMSGGDPYSHKDLADNAFKQVRVSGKLFNDRLIAEKIEPVNVSVVPKTT